MMVKYAIHTDPGTYTHSESKICAKMIKEVPSRGWNTTSTKWKKEPLSDTSRGWNPTTPQWKKDMHSGGHTHNNLPPFGTWGSLALDVAISLYLITPSFILFYILYTTGYLWEWYQREGPGDIIPKRLSDVTVGPVGISPLIHLVSRIETTYALVGFMGGSTAHFLKELELNRRSPRPGVKYWLYASPAQYDMAVTFFTRLCLPYSAVRPAPRYPIWGRIIFGTAASLASHRKFVPLSKVTTTL